MKISLTDSKTLLVMWSWMMNEYSFENERSKRIMQYFEEHLKSAKYGDYKKTVSNFIRSLADDFPAFRTAAKPNEWEKGYHCVIETLHDIANQIDLLE